MSRFDAAPAAPQAAGVGEERPLCVIAFRKGEREPELISWDRMPVGEYRLYSDAQNSGFLIDTDDGTEWVEEDPRRSGIPEHFENLRALTLQAAKDEMLSAWEVRAELEAALRAPSREPEGGAAWGAAIEAAAKAVECQIPDAAGGPMSHTNTARVFLFDAVKAIRALTPRHEAPADDGPVFHMNLLSHEDNEAWLESARRVAAKHEAPAEGAGEREALIDCLGQELADAYDCKRVWSAWSYGTMAEDDFVPVAHRIDEVADAILALRARSSAPEAREGEAVEVTIFCPQCALPHVDEGEWATTRHHKTHQCQGCGHEWRPFPFATVGVTHPAAPSADKLRIAVEAIWEIAGGRATDGHNEAGRLGRIKDRASEALAALQAEQKGGAA